MKPFQTDYRVCTGSGKPGKSWNFIVAFSEKWPLFWESAGNLLNSSHNVSLKQLSAVLF